MTNNSAEMPGTLFVISAPSGAGKTSLVRALVEQDENIKVSVSYTTRSMRPGEEEGINYHFIDLETFRDMINAGDFLEHAEVFGHYYGTSQQWVEEQLKNSDDLILEIDWQGAQQIRQLMPHCVCIFILPPSRKSLLQRLTDRGQDNNDIIQQRMAEVVNEMSHYAESDYLIINDNFNEALLDLQSIIRSYRLKQVGQAKKHKALITELLAYK